MSRSGRNTIRCETGKCCCRGDHNSSCNPRAAGKRALMKEIEEAYGEHAGEDGSLGAEVLHEAQRSVPEVREAP